MMTAGATMNIKSTVVYYNTYMPCLLVAIYRIYLGFEGCSSRFVSLCPIS